MKYVVPLIRLLFLGLFVFLLATGNTMLWLILFGISLLAALIFGRVYCGYACPMNTVMVPVDWISKRLKLKTANQPKWLKNGYFSWIALAVSVAAMLIAKKVLNKNLPLLPFWLTVSALVTVRYHPAVFHNLICPFGALQRAVGRFAKVSKRVDKKACIGCNLCERVCPSNAIAVDPQIKKANITPALCHQCHECQQVCPKDAINYNLNKNQLVAVSAEINIDDMVE